MLAPAPSSTISIEEVSTAVPGPAFASLIVFDELSCATAPYLAELGESVTQHSSVTRHMLAEWWRKMYMLPFSRLSECTIQNARQDN